MRKSSYILRREIKRRALLHDHQFGFRKHHGAVEQVRKIVSEIKYTFGKNEYCSIFLDIAQAFDKVWHEDLIYKIKLQLPKRFQDLLALCLSVRTFAVNVKSATTETYTLNFGVPKGEYVETVQCKIRYEIFGVC